MFHYGPCFSFLKIVSYWEEKSYFYCSFQFFSFQFSMLLKPFMGKGEKKRSEKVNKNVNWEILASCRKVGCFLSHTLGL